MEQAYSPIVQETIVFGMYIFDLEELSVLNAF